MFDKQVIVKMSKNTKETLTHIASWQIKKPNKEELQQPLQHLAQEQRDNPKKPIQTKQTRQPLPTETMPVL